PDSVFLKDWRENQKYYVAEKYYSFKEDNKFYVSKSYKSNYIKWQQVQDSLFTIKNLNNDNALNAYNYCLLLRDFLLREKEALWHLKEADPEKFYIEWYNSISEGELSFKNDRKNLLKEKIINKYFSGKSAEYLYAVLFNEAINNANHENLESIFVRFKNQYPASKYIAWFEPTIKSLVEKQKIKLNDKMIFADNNGLNITKFEEVLKLMKGKTVLLDMWGTWCSPCLQEIEKNSQFIKDRFQGKGLDYLYVANFDLKNEKKWKELIAYYHLEGNHVLANISLNKDIMAKVKGTGYPTYVIIKKDGSYELSKAGYPMNREILIKQLEEAIAH
ncbi:MAG: TlpA family protein disulfide reductase, partial [Sphingobacteriaceae bacterium]